MPSSKEYNTCENVRNITIYNGTYLMRKYNIICIFKLYLYLIIFKQLLYFT